MTRAEVEKAWQLKKSTAEVRFKDEVITAMVAVLSVDYFCRSGLRRQYAAAEESDRQENFESGGCKNGNCFTPAIREL